MPARRWLGRAVCSCAVLAIVLGAADARADDNWRQANQAWEQADLDGAVPKYEAALEAGGLGPTEVVIAYSRIGTYRAAQGKPEAALSAFRVAASINPAFQLPPESGPKAKALYDKARAEAARMGGKLEIKAELPDEAGGGKSFTVGAHMPEAFAALVDKIGVEVKDPMTSKVWRTTTPAGPDVSFEVPAKMAIPGAALFIRVDALDSRANRWASDERRLKVRGSRAAAVEPAAVDKTDDPFAKEPEEDDGEPKKKKGGFWASPWPYAIGGVLIVGGVSTYMLTRKSSEVSVQAPQWR